MTWATRGSLTTRSSLSMSCEPPPLTCVITANSTTMPRQCAACPRSSTRSLSIACGMPSSPPLAAAPSRTQPTRSLLRIARRSTHVPHILTWWPLPSSMQATAQTTSSRLRMRSLTGQVQPLSSLPHPVHLLGRLRDLKIDLDLERDRLRGRMPRVRPTDPEDKDPLPDPLTCGAAMRMPGLVGHRQPMPCLDILPVCVCVSRGCSWTDSLVNRVQVGAGGDGA
mmetsp:Transcript_58663/g.130686  ORF Transcript_58663/g.130686 Transcript_58663/m.130686 type:complete len:224 (-) Transcript_58663:447-1118(-)